MLDMLRTNGWRELWNNDMEEGRYRHSAKRRGGLEEVQALSQEEEDGGKTPIEQNGGGGCLYWLLVLTAVVTAVCLLADDLWLLV